MRLFVDCADTVANGANAEVNVMSIDVVSASVSTSVLDAHDPLAPDNHADNRLSELVADAASEKSD